MTQERTTEHRVTEQTTGTPDPPTDGTLVEPEGVNAGSARTTDGSREPTPSGDVLQGDGLTGSPPDGAAGPSEADLLGSTDAGPTGTGHGSESGQDDGSMT